MGCWRGSGPDPKIAACGAGSAPRLLLLRIVEREAHDPGGDPLLVAVDAADLDLGADRGIIHIHAAEGDVLLQERRAAAAGDDADLSPAGMDAGAVADRFLAVDLQADEDALRMLLALGHRLAADEILVALQRHGEAD